MAFYELGKYEEAAQSLEVARKLDPTNIRALYGSAYVYSETNRPQDAYDAYGIILEKHPNHAGAWHGRGLAAFYLLNFKVANQCFQSAAELDPKDGDHLEANAWTLLCLTPISSRFLLMTPPIMLATRT